MGPFQAETTTESLKIPMSFAFDVGSDVDSSHSLREPSLEKYNWPSSVKQTVLPLTVSRLTTCEGKVLLILQFLPLLSERYISPVTVARTNLLFGPENTRAFPSLDTISTTPSKTLYTATSDDTSWMPISFATQDTGWPANSTTVELHSFVPAMDQ